MRDFSGGLNTRVAPSLLQPNEAQVYTNVDNSSGSITPVKDKTQYATAINKYFTWYYAVASWFSKTSKSSFVEYNNILYITNDSNNISFPTKYDGVGETRVGIARPTIAPSKGVGGLNKGESGDLPEGEYEYVLVRSYTGPSGTTEIFSNKAITLSGTYDGVSLVVGPLTYSLYRKYNGSFRLVDSGTGTLYDIVHDISAGALLTGFTSINTSIVYTYYNSATGVESAPSPIKEYTILASELEGSSYNSYITGFTPSTDTQVDSIRVYTIDGVFLTQYTLLDTIVNINQEITVTWSSALAGSHILDSYENLPAPKMNYFISSYAMLFGSVDNMLYYSEIGQPEVWPATHFIDFEDTITGIGSVQNGIVVFTKYRTYLVTGNSPDTFSKYLLSTEQGCEAHYTIQFVANTLIWLSSDGLCTYSGGNIEVISRAKLGKLSLSGVENAQVFDSVYYLLHSTGILCYDFRYNQIVRNLSTTGDWLGNYNDKLYINDSTTIYTMFSGGNLSYTWKSPILTEGYYSTLKTFKNIYIKYSGAITIKVYIDGVLFNTKVLEGTESMLDLKLKQGSVGYGLEIEVTGTGEVSEIEFKAQGRQNGR